LEYGNIPNIIKALLPDLASQQGLVRSRVFKREYSMIRTLKSIFPDTSILENYTHPDLGFTVTRRKGQLDAFLPTLMLAFEYQGEQHYGHTTYERETTRIQMQRDEEKAFQAKQQGITLIHVPYWWDGTKQQLEATIASVRPELIPAVPPKAKPIPLDMENPLLRCKPPTALCSNICSEKIVFTYG
jgi:hypothetical protein